MNSDQAAHERLNRLRADLQTQLLRENRRTHFWRAALVGVLAGIVAVLFQLALNGAERFRTVFVQFARHIGLIGLPATVLFSVLVVALAARITSKYCPEASGSGIPHVKAVLASIRVIRWLPITIVKFVCGFLAIAAGLSLGREGPTVHIGACLGEGVAEKLRIPRRSHRVLIATGAGAGLSAAFNAPLAGFLFVLEEIQRDLTPTMYGAALIASVFADAVCRAMIGQRPAFHIVGYPAQPLALLPLIAVFGAVAGLIGVLFNKCLIQSGRILRERGWIKAVAAGIVAGFAVWYVPEIAGGGHRTAEIVLSGEYAQASAVGVVLVLLAGKLLLTVLSYASGVPGGIFAPMLVIGAYLGLACGETVKAVLPHSGANSAAFAVLGMSAVFASSVRAPLTGMVLIIEMTGNLEQLYALIVASLSAYLVAEVLRDRPIYEALLEEDLKRSPDSTEAAAGEPRLLEVYIEAGSYLDGRQIDSLEIPEQCAVVSVLRGDNEFAPPSRFHVRAGDVAVFVLESGSGRLMHAVSLLGKH